MELITDQFKLREQALENAFFLKRDAELLARMRSHLAEMEEQQRVAHVSGILDEHVLMDLVHAGVTAETLLAMRFVPMVAVAWADRRVASDEREAILQSLQTEGIKPGSPAYQLVERWLEHQPNEAVFAAWKEYVRELAKIMPPESLDKLCKRTEVLCYQVARAAGGVLGFGSVSDAEKRTIDGFVSSWKRS
jgi:hypothetical protein